MCLCTFFTQRLNLTTTSDEQHRSQLTLNFLQSYCATVKLLSMRVNSTFHFHISLTTKNAPFSVFVDL